MVFNALPPTFSAGRPDASTVIQAQANRIVELEDAIRGVVLCTKEPSGACVCIQYAETILNKKYCP